MTTTSIGWEIVEEDQRGKRRAGYQVVSASHTERAAQRVKKPRAAEAAAIIERAYDTKREADFGLSFFRLPAWACPPRRTCRGGTD